MTEPEPPKPGRDLVTRRTFFLALTAVWSVAVLAAIIAAILWHFAEVSSACGRTIGGRAGTASSEITFEGASVAVVCRGTSGITEIPMNAPSAGLIIAVLGLLVAITFLIFYRVLRDKRS